MNPFHSLSGILEIELTSANVGGILGAVTAVGIHVYAVEYISDLTVYMKIKRRDYPLFLRITQAKGCGVSVRGKHGTYWALRRLFLRPVLMLGLISLTAMALYLPGRVFFVQVDGNVSLPDRLILKEAEDCGITFGVLREDIRSEKVKNALLSKVPELQWVGVNTKGCIAVISVREKTQTEKADSNARVSSIIADRDGVIVSCTVEEGNAVCHVGEAVVAGQLLISGYTDCGLTIQAGRANGEVYAQTMRQVTAVTPTNYVFQQSKRTVEKKYAVIIGKKRINFYKDSGILGGSYDKMSKEIYCTLPGGFVLPVSLVTEQWVEYAETSAEYSQEEACRLLESFSNRYLTDNMVAGKVLQKKQDFSVDPQTVQLTGNYACVEMIGREQQERTLEHYGESN